MLSLFNRQILFSLLSSFPILALAEGASRQIEIPAAIQRSEAMTALYREYVGHSSVPALRDLRVGNNEGYQCAIYSIRSGVLSERPIAFQTVQSGGGRFIRLRAQQSSEDQQSSFLLTRTEQGWRGQESRTVDREITPFDVYKRLVSTRYENLSDFDPPPAFRLINSVTARSASIFCVRANTDNLRELFVEVGSKTDLLALDTENHEIHDRTRIFRIVWDSYYADYHLDAPISRLSIFIPEVFGNHSKPISFCYSDLESQQRPHVAYRMEGIGVCSLPE